ncbi:1-acyl-sn-glycerol-3-phosphate acyltransferase [Phormidesmis sp. 146-33]
MKKSDSAYSFGWFDWVCLWYPPGWLILFNRHWQHYHPDPDGWNWLEYGLFLIPGGFYVALLIRWLRLGCRSPRSFISDPDPHYQQIFQREILTPIAQRYFRAELHQVENLPDSAPVIVALNHAGMCFPWDFLCLGVLLNQKKGWFVEPVAHPIFFDHPWLVWWLPPGWAQVLGGIRAEKQRFETAVQTCDRSTVLLYAPESWRGLAKGWRDRYQLARFDPSFIRLSVGAQVPILPVACLGSEYLHPWTLNSRRLARWLKMPLLPVSPLLLVFVLFPSMGVWAMRTRLRYFLQPIECPWSRSLKPDESIRSTTYHQAEQMRSHLEKELDRLRKDKS